MNLDEVHDQFPQLQTERLLLREMQPDDAEAIFRIFSDDEVMRYYDREPYRDVDQARQMIERQRMRFRQKNGIRWGIVKKDSNAVIGTIGYAWTLHNRQGGVGYDLARSCWRQGIMSEALTTVIQFGFEQVELNRIRALVIPGNVASEQLLLRLGFKNEGVLREYGFFKSRYHDLASFSLLRNDLHIK